MDVVTVGSINYIVAAICALPGFVQSNPSAAASHAIWTGSLMGACYFVAFFFLLYAVSWVGASNSAAVSRISLVIPIGAGIWLWGETPDWIQLLGIGIAFVSLFLIGHKGSRRTGTAAHSGGKSDDIQTLSGEQLKPLPETQPSTCQSTVSQLLIFAVLAIFFLICGASRLTQQACQQLSDGVSDYPTFLQSAFAVAAIPSICVLIFRRRKISPLEVGVGVALGISNILQSHYILRSLDLFEGFLVFTVTSTGGLMLTTAVAVLYFKEKLNAQSAIGIGLACISILFLQIPFADLLQRVAS